MRVWETYRQEGGGGDLWRWQPTKARKKELWSGSATSEGASSENQSREQEWESRMERLIMWEKIRTFSPSGPINCWKSSRCQILLLFVFFFFFRVWWVLAISQMYLPCIRAVSKFLKINPFFSLDTLRVRLYQYPICIHIRYISETNMMTKMSCRCIKVSNYLLTIISSI